MQRAARLSSARHWLAKQEGRTPRQIAKSYRKWYGVDWTCAIKELTELGINFDQGWITELTRNLEGQIQSRQKRKLAEEIKMDWLGDSDDQFAFIAGYTPGGFPYGITWEEQAELDSCNPSAPVERNDDRLPF